MKDISIIIHGPLNTNTISMVNKYYLNHSIIICCPQPESNHYSIFEELTKISDLPNTSITIITYDKNILSPYYNNHLNRWYHFFSVDLALQYCYTEYVIKIRSDEFYSDLNPFYEAMIENSSKIITSDIYFRQNYKYPFHPSDHMIGGKTKIIKSVFEGAKILCESYEKLIGNKFIVNKSLDPFTLTPEQMIGIASISSVLIQDDIEKMDNIEIMKNVFHIIKASSLGTCIITSSSNKVTYTDDSYFQSSMDVDNIENYK
jgi:hypothetical protein